MILHTINKRSALGKCEHLIGPDDQVVLLEDGVYLGLAGLPFPARAIAADVEARGLQHRLTIPLLGYEEFVALSVEADKVCARF